LQERIFFTPGRPALRFSGGFLGFGGAGAALAVAPAGFVGA